MAKAILPVNYKNDILAAAMNGSRKFKITDNADGTITLEDVSTYDQVGSEFGAAQINQTNQAVNDSVDKAHVIDDLADVGANTQPGMVMGALAGAELNKNLVATDGLKFQFATDGEGNYGYLEADGSLVPFKRGTDDVYIFQNTSDEYTTAAYKDENIPMLRSHNIGFTVKTSGTYTCYAYYRGNNATYGIKPTVRINGENISNSDLSNSLSSDGYKKIMTSFEFSKGDFVDVIANTTSSVPGLRCYLVLALV